MHAHFPGFRGQAINWLKLFWNKGNKLIMNEYKLPLLTYRTLLVILSANLFTILLQWTKQTFIWFSALGLISWTILYIVLGVWILSAIEPITNLESLSIILNVYIPMNPFGYLVNQLIYYHITMDKMNIYKIFCNRFNILSHIY